MKKFLATAEILLMLNGQVEAAAVAGSDDWEDLTEQEELSSTTPLEVHGKQSRRQRFFESGTEKNNTVFTAGLDYKINRHWTIGGISHASL